ncbi:MAG: prolyl-tRNA synthetase associated domain-containing protein, partial [Clostridia bacterium]|nr:prolyl-tRNA synthetase associated domain-containing protein [Clostridia bacterium]
MDKIQIYNFLKEKGIQYKTIEHKAVFTVEEAETLNLPDPETGAKNLFLRDDKKRNYYLLTVRDALSVNLKEFQIKISSRRLSFASEEDLFRIMKLKKGAVTPFGVMNDDMCITKVYIDAFFEGNIISVHPNDNTATVYLKCNDLM